MNTSISPKKVRATKRLAHFWDAAYGTLMAAAGAIPGFVAVEHRVAAFAGCVTVGSACLWMRFRQQSTLEIPVLDDVAMSHSLEVLHALLMLYPEASNGDPKHRLCVYVRDRTNPNQLVRLTPQVGNQSVGDTDEPTGFSISVGLVGKVARLGKPLLASLREGENLVENLVSNWGFSHDEAGKVRSDRKCWYGVPLAVTGMPTIGVLVCNASDAGFFGSAKSARCKILRTASIPIAEILKRTYTSKNG
jgi:hypothetical protein